jgi:hypothetical protein rflaF_13957
MKNFFANVWTKRVAALVSLLYAFGVCHLCYLSVFFEIHIHAKVSQCLIITAVSILAIVVMLYTRKQIITRISSFIILPAMLPVVLLYFGEWGMILPIVLTGVAILLLSGAGEGAKTALGTIILLMYIFGALGYFLFTSFFVTSVKEDVVESGVSPSGKYRYRVVNTEDTSNGSTAVYVEPNDADLEYKMFYATFTLKNMERAVHIERPINETAQVEWKTLSRSEITTHLNEISDAIVVHLSEDELNELGYTYDEMLQIDDITVSRRFEIGKTASDVDPIKLDELTDEQLELFDIGRDSDGRYYVLSPSAELCDELKAKSGSRIYFSDFKGKAFEIFNDEHKNEYGSPYFVVEKDNSVYLNTLSDEQLEMIGVPEEGDVMMFNGKICFSYYVAEIEDYYDVDSRKISLDLLS